MRVVSSPADLPSAIRAARSEAGAAFGDSTIYLERRLERPRHIEVQLLADHHGTVLACVERECSIQRRHQKVIEETPSPCGLLGTARASDIRPRQPSRRRSATRTRGTVEFLVDEQGHFYFWR
jgi:acetyl/propionyl-CoA carboxylase alpha subunit